MVALPVARAVPELPRARSKQQSKRNQFIVKYMDQKPLRFMVRDKNISYNAGCTSGILRQTGFAALCRSHGNEQQSVFNGSVSNSSADGKFSCPPNGTASGGMETNRSLPETRCPDSPAMGEDRAIPGPQADAPQIGQR